MTAVDVRAVLPGGESVLARGGFDLTAPVDGEWPPLWMLDTPRTQAQWNLFRAGKGRPLYPRAVGEEQWHDKEPDEFGKVDIDAMRHIHLMVPSPRYVRPGILPIDVLHKHFHFQGGINLGVRKLKTAGWTAPKWEPSFDGQTDAGGLWRPIPEGDAGHMVDDWQPLALDLRGITESRWYPWEVDTDTLRPDGRKAITRRIHWMWIGHDTPPKTLNGTIHAEAWVTHPADEGNQFGYMVSEMRGVRQFVTDVSDSIRIKVQAKEGSTVRIRLCINPDLHAHPASYGTVLHEWWHTQLPIENRNFDATVPHPPIVLGDRLMLQTVDASIPDVGSAATLAVSKLVEGDPFQAWLEAA